MDDLVEAVASGKMRSVSGSDLLEPSQSLIMRLNDPDVIWRCLRLRREKVSGSKNGRRSNGAPVDYALGRVSM